MHASGLISNGHNKHQIYKKILSSAYTDTYYHTTWPLIFILYQERIYTKAYMVPSCQLKLALLSVTNGNKFIL